MFTVRARVGLVVYALLVLVGCYTPPSSQDVEPASRDVVTLEAIAAPTSASELSQAQLSAEFGRIRHDIEKATDAKQGVGVRAVVDARDRLKRLRSLIEARPGAPELPAAVDKLAADLETIQDRVGRPMTAEEQNRNQSILQALGAAG